MIEGMLIDVDRRVRNRTLGGGQLIERRLDEKKGVGLSLIFCSCTSTKDGGLEQFKSENVGLQKCFC